MRLRPAITPRDRLDHLLDYVRRAFRYWWVAAAFVVAGGALSTFYAIKRAPVYQSEAVLVYQPKIQSVVLGGRDAETVQRNIGDRYRELMLSRKNMKSIVVDPKLTPYPGAVEQDKVEEAIEDLRARIAFQSRGANTFRITYGDPDRGRAQKVTERLTSLLIDAEAELRQGAAQETVKFANQQKNAADDELKKRERAYTQFLNQHPEFTQDDAQGGAEGAAIRASQKDKDKDKGAATGTPHERALARQIARIKALLATPDGAPPPRSRVRSPAQLAAQQRIDESQRELSAAQRKLEDVRARFTDRHPDVLKAQGAVDAARARLLQAEAAMPPDADLPDVNPAAIDKDALRKELADFERQLAAERSQNHRQGSPAPASDTADEIVTLETEHKDLKRAVDEEREAVQTLADGVFRAEIAANQQMAENNANLAVVDPAFKPIKPHGKGKKFIVMAGVVLFGGLGAALALGLALLDDRVYRRSDVERLDLAPVLAVIPKPPKQPRPHRPPTS
jgi:protein tyrosine kinase modulator